MFFVSRGWIAALGALVLFIIIYRIYRSQRAKYLPAVFYSRISDLKHRHGSLKLTFASLPDWLFFLALGCLFIAWLDPRAPFTPSETRPSTRPVLPPTEGLAIYLLLDQSGSMGRISPADPLGPSKFDQLKSATAAFIQGRPNDLIGIIAFARAAAVVAPLTLDHDALLAQLQILHPHTDPNDDGTGIGYAIFKTVNLFVATRHFAETLAASETASYQIRDAIIVLVTDGFQNVNAQDKDKWMRAMGMEEAAEYAKANGVTLYLINIEPMLAEDKFAPHRRLLEHVTALTGGEFFLVGGPQEIARIYADIDQMARSRIPSMDQQEPAMTRPVGYNPLHTVFLASGLLALGGAVLLSTTFLRRVP